MKQLAFWGILIFLVAIRFYDTKPSFSDGQILKVSGVVVQEPVKYLRYQKVILSGLKIFLPIYPEISYGDKITVSGKVQNGEIGAGKLLSLKEKSFPLSSLRVKIISFFQETLPEPHAALVAGITIGSKASLPYVFWQEIKKTGTAHVVVASGMNVTLVAGIILVTLLLFLPRRKAIAAASLGVWAYVILSGVEAPIVRAAIMASMIFLAQATGRVVSTLRVLFLTVCLMLVVFPLWLTDIGFLLSFMATFSLILFQKKVESILTFLPKFFKENLATSLAAQIGVAPIMWVSFGNFSLLAPLVNALVLWTVGPIMILGALGGALGMIIPTLGRLVLYLSYPLTSWYIAITHLFASI